MNDNTARIFASVVDMSNTEIIHMMMILTSELHRRDKKLPVNGFLEGWDIS